MAGMGQGHMLVPFLSTCAALLLCMGMVVQAPDEAENRFVLMDWGALQAQQEQANYQKAFGLGHDAVGRRGVVALNSGARQELDHIAKVTDAALPMSQVGMGLHAVHPTAKAMLQHYKEESKAAFADLGKEGSGLHNMHESAKKMLNHWDALSKAAWPSEKRAGKDTERENSVQELARLKKLSNSVLPTEAAKKRLGVQTSQALLKHYAALNRAVFPREKRVKHGKVQDV